ncbi:hypothetical protein FLJC2902T_11650 [Flavobacterium limnosediminis JC2902]|uniref:Uncharacterized protein n=1 Tax=Flavobacterium limnosediminis JC2902 TaxID=1341181 RepID=V6SXJ0_9FLAO|nr:hypothetical protein [Flavobacterium limnosediminis]ESU29125.1 hypothetical protein FLJC2902T_11650 [Flavobacterium limnosediminis JC2902]
MKKTILTLTLTATLLSCSIQGLTNDYKKLSDKNKAKVVSLESFESTDTLNIYRISGKQLKDEMVRHPKSLVYVFTNGCTSELCKPMYVYENFAKRNGYKLFLVMNGYANLNETLAQRNGFSSPLFAIDSNYYKSTFRGTYTRYFENELQGKPIETKSGDYLGNLFFFKGNQLEKVLNDLPNG